MNRPFRERAVPKPVILPPGGRLTLVTGTPVITSDQTSKTQVFYTPDKHAYFPVIRNGVVHLVYAPDDLILTLTSAHAASSIVDVFGVEIGGNGRLVTGPAWTTATAGSGARGTGGGTTELTRAAGIRVNRWGVPGLNAEGSTYIAPMEGTYLGSLFIDGSNGQVTDHVSYGQSRKRSVWNSYNRVPIILKAGDSSSPWTYNTNTLRASNGDSTNKITVFAGLPECFYDAVFTQTLSPGIGGTATEAQQIAIGINSTTVASGELGDVNFGMAAGVSGGGKFRSIARYTGAPMPIGVNAIQCLERAPTTAGTALWGSTETGMLLTARWEG